MKQHPQRYPIYIPSKGRWESRMTIKALEKMGVQYSVIVEAQEYKEYVKVTKPKNILVLPKKYQEEYDTCDNLGDTRSKGPGAARNFAWEDAISKGHERHWVMDDNIRYFFRLCRNKTKLVLSPTFFRCMEDFIDRYKNVAMAGPNYEMFVLRKRKQPPVIFNTRIYSCNLILNDAPFRWRGRYNEDTDLSLRMLKAGWCTIQFNSFLQKKEPTQTVSGGNTKEFYSHEGTLPKSAMQVSLHPDVSKLTRKFNRWHHEVNYRPFKNNRLIKKEGVEVKQGIDNYGMEYVQFKKGVKNG